MENSLYKILSGIMEWRTWYFFIFYYNTGTAQMFRISYPEMYEV